MNGGDEDLYVADFEHSMTGRDIPVWLERDFHMIHGPGSAGIGLSYLILSVNGARVYSGIDTIDGRRAMIRDIGTLKDHLEKVRQVIVDRDIEGTGEDRQG